MNILINNIFLNNEPISPENSFLNYRRGYFLNSEIGRGDLTNEFNIEEFLNNEKNKEAIDLFLDFLRLNFTTNQIILIKQNNKLLSEQFNNFYNNSIRTYNPANLKKIEPNYSGSTLNYVENYFLNDNNLRTNQIKNGLIYTLSADSYYLDIVLEEKFNIITNAREQISKNKISGITKQKEVVYVSNLFVDNQFVTKRIVNIEQQPNLFLKGFVDSTKDPYPFSDFNSLSGIDFDLSEFQGKEIFEIESGVFPLGVVSYTEIIEPKGVTNVILGDNKTFSFRTLDPLKRIDRVLVDGQAVNYESFNNQPKTVAGTYTFSAVTKNSKIYVFFA
jgi:hypothetical protein